MMVVATMIGSISFAGIGLIGVALVLSIRQAGAATTWLVSLLVLVGGTYFPLHVLPSWLRTPADV